MTLFNSALSAHGTSRIGVNIPVRVTCGHDSFDAAILELTEYGALIAGPAPRKGMQFQIDYHGQTVFGFVIWAEEGRFGARFPFALYEGPLHDRLELARMEITASGEEGNNALFALTARQTMPDANRRAH